MIPRRPGASVMAKGSGERGPAGGPYDVDALGPDAVPPADSVDFGALRVPVPDGGTVTVEPTEGGRMQAVHVTVGEGRLSVSALAAPKSATLWPDLAQEIDASLREGGARVRSFPGEWGRELHATTGAATSVFVGVDGPRWMLYGVATGPSRDAVALDARLRIMVRGTVVVRGRSPYPVRTVLPLVAPPELAPANGAAPESPDSVRTTALPQVPRAVPRDAAAGAATAAFSTVVRAARPGPEIAAGATGPSRRAEPARRAGRPAAPGADRTGGPSERRDRPVGGDAPVPTDPPTRRRPAGPGSPDTAPPTGGRRRRPDLPDGRPVTGPPAEPVRPAAGPRVGPGAAGPPAEPVRPARGPLVGTGPAGPPIEPAWSAGDPRVGPAAAGSPVEPAWSVEGPRVGLGAAGSPVERAWSVEGPRVGPAAAGSSVERAWSVEGPRVGPGAAGSPVEPAWSAGDPRVGPGAAGPPVEPAVPARAAFEDPASGGRHRDPALLDVTAARWDPADGVRVPAGGGSPRPAGADPADDDLPLRPAAAAPEPWWEPLEKPEVPVPGELPIFDSVLAGEPADGVPGRHAAPEGRRGPEPTAAPPGRVTSRAAGHRASPDADGRGATAARSGSARGSTNGHRAAADAPVRSWRGGDRAAPATPAPTVAGPDGRASSGGRRAASAAPDDPAGPVAGSDGHRAAAATTGDGAGWSWPEQSSGRRRSRDASWSAADLLGPDQPGPRRRRAAPEPGASSTGRHFRPED